MDLTVFHITMLWIVTCILVQNAERSVSQGFRHGVTREIWQSVSGQHLYNLTSSSQYQESPTIKDTLNHFVANENIGNNYGQRLTTFYRAPETGQYVFYLTCQDECELWLSTNDAPDNIKRILFISFGLNLNYNEWERSPTQKSLPVHLCSGEFYFMQAIMKAGSSSHDHLGVGVLQPRGEKYQPILNGDLFFELPERRRSLFLLVGKDTALVGHVMSSLTVGNMECSLYCARDKTCQSYNYFKEQGICELNNETSANNAKRLVPSMAVEYYEKI
ncbi:uncharacterized protein LOC110049362 [Orbicella faveolata]|uniref:uncharacterized protein LOC110049362 n=1 Tax=Orbicella faveolata TaxID=48498 RepID=UPI0009E2E79E|nr:uncharacterized protein LOC110049362 [Orbicella faveolata]